MLAAEIYPPTSRVSGLLPNMSSPLFLAVCFLHDGHSDWGEVESQRGFDLHVLLTKDVERFFMYLLATCVASRTVCSFRLLIC
jgi:hypothetical protein